MIRFYTFIVTLMIGGQVFAFQEADVLKMRRETEEATKKNWLVVVGLHWLKNGNNSLGSDPSSNVVLPLPVPAKLGNIHFEKNTAQLTLIESKGVKIDGTPAVARKPYLLKTDKAKKQRTEIQVGSVTFYLIERPNGIGLRVKDLNAETLKKFKGLEWWEPQKEYSTVGNWKPYNPPKVINMPDILGNSSDEKLEGSVVFELKGQKHELFPVKNGEDLFFVFKDQTTGKSSYGTGRFLEAKLGKDGKVVLDFNQAYNPPCAHIAYATCPIAPAENKLNIAIEAGEKKPAGH